MSETFRALADNWIVMVALIFFTAWLIGHTIEQIRIYACHRRDAELKRDLADRGLSADEIERIVAAQSSAAAEKVEVEERELVAK